MRFWARSNKPTLSDILSSGDNREFLLGVIRQAPPTEEQMKRDTARVIQYSQTEDYAVWAKNAWARVTEHIDHLMDAKTSSDQAAFHRGALAATVTLLRESYKARFAKQAEKKTA